MPLDPLHEKSDVGSFVPEQLAPPGVAWMQKHPYAIVSYGLAVALIISAVIVVRDDSAPRGDVTVWSGDPVIIDRGDYDPPVAPPSPERTPPPTILEDLSRNDQSIVLPTTLVPDVAPPPEDTFDIQEFVRGLGITKTPRATSSTPISDLIQEAYSFIPSGLIAVTTPKERSPVQQALFGYGNDVGLEIQAFEGKYPNAVAILTNHAGDRGDVTKAAALEQYAKSMTAVGEGILAIEAPPAEVASIHEALGKSYVTMGSNLTLVSKSISDSDFLFAIETYNKTVEAHTKEFVALATLFSTYEVRFSSGDPGRVFTFTPGGF